MKKIILLTAMIATLQYSYAAPADPTPRKVIQPNGDTLIISHRGDEFNSYYLTNDKKVVDKDNDGTWKYVVAENGKLKLGSIVPPPMKIKLQKTLRKA